jgi:deazaflavin-dependent oxidoreductase (nitroreductase family)
MASSIEKLVLGNLLRFHHELYVRSGGRIGQHWLGSPSLILAATGAKSGEPRVCSLTYAEDGDRYVIVASNGGSNRAPAWYFNLRARPDVSIQVGTRRLAVHARIVSSGDADYERLFTLADETNRGRYRAYQRRTDRPIPVVVLEPTGA